MTEENISGRQTWPTDCWQRFLNATIGGETFSLSGICAQWSKFLTLSCPLPF